ncbi:carboxypeptidase-like regulatory domain-containing protein [Botryobacter ruber]|uniref:carboxypeptidase-like regulatory domain-containing protein n=1 Tax=Botryobacter ruber TaxID=2171629 RepID=UPI001F0C9F52|nr:carboxypeptidase-like regulatory domain-containing protein [Botryobacter ruber]
MNLSSLTRIPLPASCKWLLVPVLALVLAFTGTTQEATAQVKRQSPQGQQRGVVQLSGFVAIGDSLYGVGGVVVYVPGTSRGTQTNEFGYFSLPVLTGDSVVFNALGYKKEYLIIPENYKSQGYSIIMQLQEDVKELPMVEVFPWPTERDFRQAVLNAKLPDDGRAVAMRNLDPEVLEDLFKHTPMDGAANFRNWNQQHIQRVEQKNMIPTISPFAVLKLIDMIRNGEFKKK